MCLRIIAIIIVSVSIHSCTKEKHKQYYENGNIQCEYSTDNGKFCGRFTSYYDDGRVLEEGRYRSGKQSGLWTSHYANGDVAIKRKYHRGHLVSIDAWDKHGVQVVSKGNGTVKEYYESGDLKSVISYKENHWDGEMSSWYENGIKEQEQFFDMGIPVGTHKKWDDKGNLTMSVEYITSNDTVYSITRVYYHNGQIQSEHKDADGRTLSIKTWNENGELICDSNK